jgi:hypothetical protein
MMEQLTSRDRSDLLAYALFDDHRVGDARQSLLAFLISLTLFEKGTPATREEILGLCRSRFLPNDGVVLDQIEVVVSAAQEAGLLVDEGDGRIALAPVRYQHLSNAAKRIDSFRDAFHREIATKVEEEMNEKPSDKLAAEMRAVMEGFVQRLFQEESVALANAFIRDGNGLEGLSTDQMRPENLESLARSMTTPAEKFRRAQIATGIQRGVLELSPTGQRYLATVYQKTVAFHLLQQDPGVRRIKRKLAAQRAFYLDANVVMPLIFSAHPKHEQVRTAIDAARDVGCQLLVSPFTLTELEAQLTKSDKRYSELKSYKDVFSIFNDDILRTYGMELKRNPDFSWHAFFAGFDPLEELLAESGIHLSDVDATVASHDSRNEMVFQAVRNSKPPYTSRKVVDTDSRNILLVQVRRKKIKADEMGRRVWLITLDHNLKYAERQLVSGGVYEVPSTKHVSVWASGLAPHLSPDEEDLGEYVLRVVQSQLGLLAADPIFADIDFLATLKQSPFDIDDLMASNPNKTRRVLIALEERREIGEILREEPDEPRERDAWGARLTEVVREALRKLDEDAVRQAAIDAAEAERDSALVEAEAMRRDREEFRQRVSEMEETSRREEATPPKEASTESFWTRMWAWATRNS